MSAPSRPPTWTSGKGIQASVLWMPHRWFKPLEPWQAATGVSPLASLQHFLGPEAVCYPLEMELLSPPGSVFSWEYLGIIGVHEGKQGVYDGSSPLLQSPLPSLCDLALSCLMLPDGHPPFQWVPLFKQLLVTYLPLFVRMQLFFSIPRSKYC